MADELTCIVDGKPATQVEWQAAMTAAAMKFPLVRDDGSPVYKPVPTLTRKLRLWRAALDKLNAKRAARGERLKHQGKGRR